MKAGPQDQEKAIDGSAVEDGIEDGVEGNRVAEGREEDQVSRDSNSDDSTNA